MRSSQPEDIRRELSQLEAVFFCLEASADIPKWECQNISKLNAIGQEAPFAFLMPYTQNLHLLHLFLHLTDR